MKTTDIIEIKIKDNTDKTWFKEKIPLEENKVKEKWKKLCDILGWD